MDVSTEFGSGSVVSNNLVKIYFYTFEHQLSNEVIEETLDYLTLIPQFESEYDAYLFSMRIYFFVRTAAA